DRHIVEQDDIRPAADCLQEARVVLHLNLYPQEVGGLLPGALDGVFYPACSDEVVVFDQHAAGEVSAVVLYAAHLSGVLLQAAPAGGGLAGIDDPAGSVGDRPGVALGLGGDAAEALEEVERRALSR